MPHFSYRAVNASGEVIQGEMEAADKRTLVQMLKKQGYIPVHTQAGRAAGRGAARTKTRAPRRRKGGKVTTQSLVLFTRELATLIGAGLPLDRALSTIAEQSQAEAMAAVAGQVLDKVRSGSSLADAMAAQGGAFPNYYVGLVRAGEAGGTLHEVLADLAQTQERAQAMQHEIRAALNYPILVVIAAGVSVIVLLVGVIPEFEPLFAGAGDTLPFTAQAVLSVSRAFREFWWALPIAAIAMLLVLRQLRRSAAARAQFDALALRLPVLGPLVRKVQASRFCRALGTLLGNGVDVVPAVEMSVETLSNARLSRDLRTIAPALKRGEGLAEPLAATNAFPPLAVQLMRVGEASGQLSKMLLTTASIYDEEVRRDTGKLISLLVPVVTLVLGVIVATIIGAVLSAILSSYDMPL